MKPIKNKLAVTIVILSVVFLSLIFISVKNKSNALSSGVGFVVTPLQKIVYTINDKIKDGIDFFVNFAEVKKENEQLKKENLDLENKLIEYDKIKAENERMREILKFSETRNNYDYVGCNIVGYSGDNFVGGYIIDKGSKDGIEKEMIVITPEGLVGKVTKSERNYSIVQSIINENIAVAVKDESTKGTTGILKGLNSTKENPLAKIYNLPIDSKIKEGDIILTSGLGLIYPKDIKIGEVVSIETDSVRVMKNAVVKPYVDFNKLDELYIVIPKDKIDVKYD